MEKVDIGTAYQLENDWFIRVMLGPFKSKEEADEFAALVGLLDPSDVAPTGNLGQLLEISSELQELKDETREQFP